jgi:hypothetical protein
LLAASSLALAPLPSFATTFTIGNSTSSFTTTIPESFSGQSFTPNFGGNAADSNFTTVSGTNPAQVYITNFTFTGFTGTAPSTLNIYSNSNRTGLVTSSTSNSGFSYTFDGATALAFGTQYFALFPTDVLTNLPVDTAGSYNDGGTLYIDGNNTGIGTTFTATFNAPVTAIPFEFSPTAGIVLLGGLWGAKRLTKKYLAQRASKPSVKA